MALVKTVEMRVLADAGDAQRQLDELDAKAKKLDGESVKMRFRLDDAEGQAQLDELRAKADRLGFKDVSIKVRVDGAGRAIADLSAVRREEEKARRASGGGLLDRLNKLNPFGGGAPGAGALMSGGLMSPAGIAAMAAAAAALLPELAGLVSGFAAAGAGAGAFYLLAHPAINNLQQDVKALSAANQNLGFAQQRYLIDPTKAHAKALHEAQVQYQAVYRQMGQDAGPAAAGVLKLHDSYVKLSNAFAPNAFKIFNDGLKIANNLLPAAKPFADTFATSVDGLLKKADKFTKSKGFADWLKQFHSLEGPAIGAIGDGIGKVAISAGKLLTVMSGKDVAHAINIAFGAISGTISAVAGTVKYLMNLWDGATIAFKSGAHTVASAFDSVRHYIAGIGHDVAHDFDTVRHAYASVAGAIKGAFSGAAGWLVSAGSATIHGLEHGAASAWGAVSGWFSGLGGKIKGAFSGAAGWLVSAGKSIIDGLVRGIESAAGAAVSAVEHVASSIIGAAKSFLGIFSPSKKMQVIGQQTIQGLILGLEGGQSAVTAAATAIGNTVAGPDSTITAAVAKLKAYVPGDTGLNKWLSAQNAKLQALAKQRAVLEQEIQNATQVAQSEIQNNSIMNAATAGPDPNAVPVTSSQLTGGMQYQVSQVKAFLAAVRQLRAEGLNATSLSQIIGAGSAQGLPVAQGLLSGGKQAVAQINQLQAQLKSAASKLGDASAAPMYQAGVQAAQGLAAGIKSQLSAVSGAISQLASAMVDAIRKALKSHSPSLVMAQIGESIPQGVALGIGRAAHVAVAASAQLAASTVQPWGGARGGAGGGGGDLHVHFHGITPADKYATAQQVHQVMRDYKRSRGNAPLGLG